MSNIVDSDRFEKKRQEIDKVVPPTSELARLAAFLAQGRLINKPSTAQFAQDAFDLWEACDAHRQKMLKQKTYAALGGEIVSAEMSKIPQPKSYPVKFDDFLRLLVGGKYKSNRLKIYRDYVKAMILGGHIRQLTNPNNPSKALSLSEAEKTAQPATLDEIEDWMRDAKARSFGEGLYQFEADAFLRWKNEQPVQRAKRASKVRWNQARRHKANFKRLDKLDIE